MSTTDTTLNVDAIAGIEVTNQHDPHLYDVSALAPVLPDPSHVDDQAVAFYQQHGYLAIASVFNAHDIQRAQCAIADLIDGKHADYTGAQFEAGTTAQQIAAMSVADRRDKVRKLWLSNEDAPRYGLAVDHPILLSIVARLMQPRVPKLIQAMALLKPPGGGREKPWHQDHAYFSTDLCEPVVGVWIALDDATLDNGCMRVLDAGHHTGPIPHFKKRDWQICDTHITPGTAVGVPLARGGALFFNSLLPHGTPTNHSASRRRSVQFHYAPTDAKVWTETDRLNIFGGEGRNVTC